MSGHEHCPSKKELHQAKASAREQSGAASAAHVLEAEPSKPWRSLDEVADTPEFREFLEREFPAGASELREETTRRDFLKIMGASVALAGAATIPGCRRPDHKIMPYSAAVPEDVIPGKPLFYATSMPLPGGGAEGLLVETHEGRPTKVEGNPFHPINRGKSSIWAQASVLGLYDPDRLKYPVYRGVGKEDRVGSWEDFKRWAVDHFARYDATRGRGLAVIVQKRDSHTREAMRQRFMERFPQALWVAYDANEAMAPVQGAQMAFGAPASEVLSFTQGGKVAAEVIVSFDRDFLCHSEPASLPQQREFAQTRRVLDTHTDMSRLYVFESGFSHTGAAADHRFALAPSRVTAAAVLLARAVLSRVGPGQGSELAQALSGLQVPQGADFEKKTLDAIEALADDLIFQEDHGARHTRVGKTLILAGPTQPAEVHALTHALNALLGNIGKTVNYLPLSQEAASDSARQMGQLAQAISAGQISTLICIDTNPVYNAPAELNFAELFQRVPMRITLSDPSTETAAASTWALNGTHYLESWGDTIAADGTVAPIQPMIAPLYAPAYSEIEFLAMIADPHAGITQQPPAGEPGAAPAPPIPRVDDGFRILRETWAQLLGQNVASPEFDKTFKRALHDGVLPLQQMQQPQPLQVNFGQVAQAISQLQLRPAPTQSALDVYFTVGHMADGSFANNGWLAELPQPGSLVVWDNPALISPATAAALGLLPEDVDAALTKTYTSEKYPSGRIGTITVNGRSLQVAFWILPGMADYTIALQHGWGRTHAGRVADGVGFNTYQLATSAGRRAAGGAAVEKARGFHPISSTQQHWTMEGRDSILRQVDLVAWQKYGAEKPLVEHDQLYGVEKTLNFGERVGHGELTHTPPNMNIYPHPYLRNQQQPLPGPKKARPRGLEGRDFTAEQGSEFSTGQQWGMSIDLATCTGCGTCTIACQAENNIPIVGKKEVAKGREMHWIRVDRYYTGSAAHPEAMMHQPVACQHCDNAPCETVCPVNATVQGPEGINYQVYNRCIGTRYCENNCPYKVRRFNFFDYGVTRFNGDYIGKETIDSIAPDRGGITGSGVHNKVNPNLVPPRLREKLTQIERMQKNPDVTVRSRGVMEKCTYCIQRINEARIEMKLRKMPGLPDGFVQAACQQACPSDAIVFGDMRDTTSNNGQGSRLHQMHTHQRSYLLLGFLNTRPRTTYMVRVMNPNPRIRKPVEDPFGHGGHDSHGGEPNGHAPAGEAHGSLGEQGLSRSAFLRDGTKKLADKGYALSLRVLNTVI